MKNKLFIQESDLEKILGALAEEAIKNSDKLRTHVTIGYDVFEGNYLRVDVSSAKTYQIILSKTYSIVSGLEKGDDVVDDTITLALGNLKLLHERAENQSETTNQE